MSIQAMTWAFRQSVGSPIDKLVLIMVANEADTHGCANVDPFEMGEANGLTAAEVVESLRKLAGLGYLEVEHDGATEWRWGLRLNLIVERPVWGRGE